MDAAKLLLVFVIIILALRRKLSVAVSLFGAGIITALLYQVEIGRLLGGYWELVQSRRFISLTSVIVLITTLGQLLNDLRFLERLSQACNNLPGGSRTAAVIMPPLVGLMPMPGGSLLSAPLVGNVLTATRYPNEFRTATNYWFRHIVEFFWPIYPGIILTEAITGLPVGSVSLMQAPLSVGMAVIGLIFFARKIHNSNQGDAHLWRSLVGIINSVWPIALAIAIYGILRIDLAIAVAISLLVLIAYARPSRNILVSALKKGFSYQLVFLVFGTLSFQTALELSGAIKSIPELSMQLNLPEELLIFLVCFTAGILTGMVAAFVALGYTLLACFLYQPEIVPGYILLAYLSGYLGMILSPTHLCLILTNEYFESDLLKVYRRLAVPVILLAALGFLLYLSPWPTPFRSG
jgi:integral membrane protein (TIGR00529 family)